MSVDGEGILLTGIAASGDGLLLDTEELTIQVIAAKYLENLNLPATLPTGHSAIWVDVDGDWEVELTGGAVEVTVLTWEASPGLLGKRSTKGHLSLQKEDGAQRIDFPVTALVPRDLAEVESEMAHEILKDLKCGFALLGGASKFLVALPQKGQTFDQLSVDIRARLMTRLEEERKNRETAEAERQERERRGHEGKLSLFATSAARPDIFVNPFNFVPLPADVAREEPVGHHEKAQGRHSGRIEVSWLSQSPLLFGDGHEHGLEPDPSGGFRVAGSSLKGFLRSLHETISGSCLRIFDTEAVPVYRQPVAVQQNRQLAVVSAVDSLGRPSKVRICGAATWARIDLLHACRGPEDLRTGDLFDGSAARGELVQNRGRSQFVLGSRFKFAGPLDPGNLEAADGKWVVLLSGAGARWGPHPYYAALGLVPSKDTHIGPEVVARWEREVDGSEDLRKRRGTGKPRGWQIVKFPPRGNGKPMGRRREVPEMPEVGDVLWVDVNGGRVTGLAASYLWRISGSGAAGERSPKATHPCGSGSHGEHLCLSCRCFGSAGEDRRERVGESEQNSYRGQVRVSEMRIDLDPRDLVKQKLPPRGNPRIGSGQFTLQISDRRREEGNNQLPAAAWGSRSETNPPRQIRGRKFYWHGHTDEPQGEWRRDTARSHQSEAMTSDVRLVPRGTKVSATIWFENLSDLELGTLIATLDPIRLLRPERDALLWRRESDESERREQLWTHLGGGKGLGFGSVQLEQAEVVLEQPDRYRGATPQALTAEQMDGYVATVRAECFDRLATTWRELAAMLDPDRIDPRRLAYPPNAPWSDLTGVGTHEPFDKSFTYFGETKGGGLTNNPQDITTLPAPSSDAPWLKILGNGR